MILGRVSHDGVPSIVLNVGGAEWTAIIDTGFNGDVEAPESLREALNARFMGRVKTILAGGRIIAEEAYSVKFPFDGEMVEATAAFADTSHILIGTHLLRMHKLEIGFLSGYVELERE